MIASWHWKLSSVSYCPWSEWWLVHVLDDCLMALETLFSVLLSMVRMMVSTCIRWLPHWKLSSVSSCLWSEWWLVHVLDDFLMALWKLSSVSSCLWSEWWLVHVLDDCLMALETLLQCPPCPWSEWWLVHVLDDCLMALETLFSVLLSMVRMMVSTCIRWLPYGVGKLSSVSSCPWSEWWLVHVFRWIALWRWKTLFSVLLVPWSEWWLVHVLDDCLMALETLFSVLLSMVRMMVSTCIRWLPYGVGNTLQCPTVHGQNDG